MFFVVLELCLNKPRDFSRMLRKRVPILRLGSRGRGGYHKSLRLCSQSVRTRPQASASVEHFLGVENRRETQNCRHFRTCVGSSSLKRCQQSQGAGRSCSRNAELSFRTRVGSSRLKSVNHQMDRGRSWSRNTELSFWARVGSSRLKSANGHRDWGGRGRETQNCRHF